MAKHEPYDRTGVANESFELPHISDREGSYSPDTQVFVQANRL